MRRGLGPFEIHPRERESRGLIVKNSGVADKTVKEEYRIAVGNVGQRDNNSKKRGKRLVVTVTHGASPLQGVPEHSVCL